MGQNDFCFLSSVFRGTEWGKFQMNSWDQEFQTVANCCELGSQHQSGKQILMQEFSENLHIFAFSIATMKATKSLPEACHESVQYSVILLNQNDIVHGLALLHCIVCLVIVRL